MTMATIKGYYPLHLIFPSSLDALSSPDEEEEEEEKEDSTAEETHKMHTYMYFKPHQIAHTVTPQTSSGKKDTLAADDEKSQDQNKILFVANVPMIPGIQTSLLLEYIFSKFGKMDHVVIVPSPMDNNKRTHTFLDGTTIPLLENIENGMDSYQDVQREFYHPGKFAHVYFQSAKERKRALQHVTRLPKGILHLDSDTSILELKELSNTSYTNFQEYFTNTMKDAHGSVEEKKGIHALVQWHQRSIPNRTILQQKCDEIMSAYEDTEQKLQESQQEEKMGVVGPDGFITVSYKTMASSMIAATSTTHKNQDSGILDAVDRSSNNRIKRRATSSRGAPKKDRKVVRGSEPLPDFYKFQGREGRKRTAEELKEKFQQDLQRVKKLKEEKGYRPF